MMKFKYNPLQVLTPTLVVGVTCILTLIVFLIPANGESQDKPNDEVVLVNKELMLSHDWDSAAFDITCIDSLQEQNGYYWAIYDSPDQFDSVLCLSMNHRTYRRLRKAMRERCPNLDRFHIYYGDCEEVVLMFE